MAEAAEKDFIALVTSHKGIIHKICWMYRDGLEDREDLFQEITYQLWKSFPSFKGKAKESTWLYRVALNTAMASFRKKKPPVTYTDTLPEWPDEKPDAEQEDRENRLFAILKKLEDGDKALMALYLEEMSYQEIASIVGISESNVGVKLNRIKTKIKDQLNNQHGIK